VLFNMSGIGLFGPKEPWLLPLWVLRTVGRPSRNH
jgi:hypothetical protein